MESTFLVASNLFRQGRFQEVLRLAEPYLSRAPQAAWLNLAAGSACALGRLDEAEAHLRELVTMLPDSAEIYSNLGSLLKSMGRLEEAESALRRALALDPALAAAHSNLGIVLHSAGRHVEAEPAYRKAITLERGNAEAVSVNLGILLKEMGRLDEAESIFSDVRKVRPSNAEVHFNLGLVYSELKRVRAAEDAFRRALVLNPRHVGAQHGLASLLFTLGRVEEAEKAYLGAMALAEDDKSQPLLARYKDNVGLLNGFGNLLKKNGRYREARAAYRRVLEINPLKGNALCQSLNCSQYLCEWGEVARETAELDSAIASGVEEISPFLLLSLPGFGLDVQRKAAEQYAAGLLRAQLAVPPLVSPSRHSQCDYSGRGRLRIGYLSADLQQHATLHLLGGVFEAHDRTRFSIHAYSYGPSAAQDDHRLRVKSACDVFRDLDADTDVSAAARIADDDIDILIDLKGYTGNCRLGIQALRPAPVVVSWLGYPGSLGHSRLADYLIGDQVVTPLEHAAYYSETLALMPNSYQPNDAARAIGPRPERRQFGLPEQGLVFCSFNQSYKITDNMFNLWCRLLVAVPGSVLWLLKPEDEARQNLQQAAVARGVEPERLVFTTSLPHTEHLARLQLADLALDTFPYGSHTTGSDALWAGVPLIARMGETFASRVSASLLHAVGLPELVAVNDEAHFELVLELALNDAKRQSIRDKLASQRQATPLFDTQRFTRDLERLYCAIWEQHGRGERGPVIL